MSPSKKTPSKRSPSPPPRRLSSTLASTSLTTEFLIFLQELDKASLVPEEECGQADVLRFILEVRQLVQTEEEKRKVSLLEQIGRKYFSPTEDGRRLALENSLLWTRCRDLCADCGDVTSAQESVTRAHDSLVSDLDELHLQFLQTRRQTSRVEAVMCLL